jgi:hypothetical protein
VVSNVDTVWQFGYSHTVVKRESQLLDFCSEHCKATAVVVVRHPHTIWIGTGARRNYAWPDYRSTYRRVRPALADNIRRFDRVDVYLVCTPLMIATRAVITGIAKGNRLTAAD